MSKVTKQTKWGTHTITLETGEIARQATSAVFVNMSGTQVLVTVVVGPSPAEHYDFFPLTVHYQEKYFAAGKIPGGFIRRESRPNETETLTARLLDRPIRPLFPENYRQEVQITATLLSFNPEVAADIVAMVGVSAALAISGVPFGDPIAGVRVGYHHGVYLLNPDAEALKTSELDLVVAGTKESILMVESEAKELSESVMLGAVMYGHEMMKPMIETIAAFAKEVKFSPRAWTPAVLPDGLESAVKTMTTEAIQQAYTIKEKTARYEKLDQIRKDVVDQLSQQQATYLPHLIEMVFHQLESQIVRTRILDGEPRIDGRDHQTVRPITIRTGCLERAHGSALFTRGETQALVTVTLGNERDAQILDNLSGETRDRFMLHYNFPHYAVGETGAMGSPKRREIGHGRLARRGLTAVLPTYQNFPYVVRVVSDITESNGSSSMATVCGSSLALMDAGVPITAPVAGVAMGLIKQGEQFAILTDILGDEDHLGDMDFKVAGTAQGITALQMDIKMTGITQLIMEKALDQAREGRLHILNEMAKCLSKSRSTLSSYAPRITTMRVPEDKIRTVIGKGGVTIKGIIESTGVQVDIDDTGLIQLFSPHLHALQEAEKQIKRLVAEIEIGQVYEGRVTKIVDFGAFVNILPGKDGLLHISQICHHRAQKIDTFLMEGQTIRVLVADLDRQGRIKLEWCDKPSQENTKTTSIIEDSEE